LVWIGWLLFWLVAVPATAWMTLAVYIDLPWPPGRMPLAAGVALAAAALMTVPPLLVAAPAWAAMFGLVLWWWLTLRPRTHRQWAAEVAQVPRIVLEGDRVHIRNFRNFEYPARGQEPLPRYEERTFDLARLESVDYFLCHWAGPAVAHSMVSFGFGDGQHLCISVEARKEQGEQYSTLRSFFRQFELIYVIGDERDLVRLRVAIRKESVYLYRVNVPPERIRRFLLACLERAESLAVRPEWYNALTSNCATNLFDLMERPPRGLRVLEVLLSGFSARYLHRKGGFAGHLSFAELKARSLLSEAAVTDAGPDFSRRLRAPLVEAPPPAASFP
jgi:hypothetical protein